MGLLKKIISTALLFLVAWEVVKAAPAADQDHCSVRFQKAFQEVIQLKKTCGAIHYKDCCQIADTSKTFGSAFETGNYFLNNPCEDESPFSGDISPMQARCNMESDGGGWIVLVRRTPEVATRESFNRNWKEYENGFGNLSGEFWYGLKNMHCLTTRESMEVEVELSKINGTKLLLSYGTFIVKGVDSRYTLKVSDKRHDGFDFLGYYHTGREFATKDSGNAGSSCARQTGGGWWYNACYNTDLTLGTHPQLYQRSTSTYMPFDYAEMRVRSKKCSQEIQEPPTCSK